MDISILFSTYKRAKTLDRTLESFCALNTVGLTWEIIVVDNAGEEQTKKIIDRYSNKLPVSYFVETKPGKNAALNFIVPKAKGELIVFTDDDIIADPDWLLEVCKGAERWQDHAVFGGRILPYFSEGDPIISMDHPYFNGVYVCADWEIEEGPYKPKQVWGANLIIRSSIFSQGFRFNETIGPDGSDYVMGSETELTVRLHQSGYVPVYLPKAVVYHQIRKEQLGIEWLKGRFYRMGKTTAYNNSQLTCKYLWGVPRFAYRKIIKRFIMMINPLLSRTNRIDYTLKFQMSLGYFQQFRKAHKAKKYFQTK